MTENEQIEEIARTLCGEQECGCDDCNDCSECYYEKKASVLYSKGYRKVERGEWRHPSYAPFGGIYEMKRCTVCGYKPDRDNENPYTKFCPECGADMRGEDNER